MNDVKTTLKNICGSDLLLISLKDTLPSYKKTKRAAAIVEDMRYFVHKSNIDVHVLVLYDADSIHLCTTEQIEYMRDVCVSLLENRNQND